jgi:hypothetical protein
MRTVLIQVVFGFGLFPKLPTANLSLLQGSPLDKLIRWAFPPDDRIGGPRAMLILRKTLIRQLADGIRTAR